MGAFAAFPERAPLRAAERQRLPFWCLVAMSQLPGIPGYVDRVSAESIWRHKCNSETEYLKHRTKHPPKAREHFGSIHGFEVIRHPTYVQIKQVSDDLGDGMSSAGSWRPSVPRSITPPGDVEPNDRAKLAAYLENSCKASPTYFGTNVPKGIRVPKT